MFFLVYRITNTINGKHYTGAHKTTNKDDGYFGSSKTLKSAITKYGKSVFKKTILCECDNLVEMFMKEKELVTIGPMSYNMKEGGHGGWPENTLELRAKISAAHMGMTHSLATRAKLSASLTGRTICAEARANMSAALVGRPVSKETRAKISSGNLGKIVSSESRIKMSMAHLGVPLSVETCMKMSKSRLGKKRGPYKKRESL